MNRILSTCFLIIALVAGVGLFALRQTPNAHAAGQTNPPLQKGISVEMAVTTGAGQLPDADRPDAWIVTVTSVGELYFGADPVPTDGLFDVMKVRPRDRSQELYIKADAHVPFSTVRSVIGAAHEVYFRRVVLLTSQPSGAPSGTMVPPTGMPLWIGAPTGEPILVDVAPGQGSPVLKVNREEVPLRTLHHKLVQLLEGRSNREVLLKVGNVPFADVAHVVDVCNMTGAKPVVDTPEL